MNPSLFSLLARPSLRTSFAVSSVFVTALACSSSAIPIGKDLADSGGAGTEAGHLQCGSTTCASGDLCCESGESCTLGCVHASFCPAVPLGACEVDAGDHDAKTDGGSGSALQWYATCGDPVCGAGDAGDVDSGACATIGTSCTTKGQTCGVSNPNVNCGAIEVCDDHDPKVGGCPMSSKKFKDDIEYLGSRDLEALHDEALHIRLATYNYKGQYADPNPKHLGFIVEDIPQSLAVDRGHDRVDLYGYLSMVVATMQVQEQEITKLREELSVATGNNACSSSR